LSAIHYIDRKRVARYDPGMKKLAIATGFLALFLFPAAASAQVFVSLGWSAPPPLVEVSPGVQVVENGNEEVFFTNGRYWVERDGRWYSSRDHRGHWAFAERRVVPAFLVQHRRGEYAHWRRADHMRRGEMRAVRHEQVREVRHAQRDARHAEVREVRQDRHEERRRH
jgi:hypothetical protein